MSRRAQGVRSPDVRWVVRDGDGPRLGDVLERLGSAAEGALEQGRVFVGKRRASSRDGAVAPGDVVQVRSARSGAEPAITVLERRGGLIAVDKPAPLSTEPDLHGSSKSLRSLLAVELKLPESELHAVSRLDVGVSGIVLLAATERARGHAVALREAGAFHRRYVGISAGVPGAVAGRFEQPITERGRTRAALTDYRILAELELEPGRLSPGTWPRAALLALDPLTGRTHQLRRHALAGAGPLLGDRRYGGPTRLRADDGSIRELSRVLLHAREVELTDEHGSSWKLGTELPPEFGQSWTALGGTDADFATIDE